jgi:tRNA threonylcarbamoyladenosine biosynthesis protein TsaE
VPASRDEALIGLTTSSPSETTAVGMAIGSLLRPGDLVLVEGELGAGKTVLTQGIGAALGVLGAVTSPTFILLRAHRGRLPLLHVDLYRLEDPAAVADLGIGELLEEGAVAVVEWGERARDILDGERLEIGIGVGADPEQRELSLCAVGRSWHERLRALEGALEEWRDRRGATS